MKQQQVHFARFFCLLRITTVFVLSPAWAGTPKSRTLLFPLMIQTEKKLTFLILGNRPLKTHMLDIDCSLDTCISEQ